VRQAAQAAQPPAADAPRGAFGQKTDGADAPAAAPQNRAQRRAAGKKN
jgi:preprotein translocase subunit SecA